MEHSAQMRFDRFYRNAEPTRRFDVCQSGCDKFSDGAFGGEAASYINGVFSGTTSAEAALPTGLTLWVPAS